MGISGEGNIICLSSEYNYGDYMFLDTDYNPAQQNPVAVVCTAEELGVEPPTFDPDQMILDIVGPIVEAIKRKNELESE